MTELLLHLRRSPRTLLERDGHPGPGPGRLALVMSRAGVGKTAFLVGIGIDGLLSGQRVLHISLENSVDKVRDFYDDLLMEMLQREKKLDHRAAIQLEVERRRHIHAYVGGSFALDRLKQALDLLGTTMEFKPDVLVIDGLDLEDTSEETLEGLRQIAAQEEAELWMSCLTHRDGPEAKPGHLPPPAHRFQDQIDLAFRLDPFEARIRLQVLKDRQEFLDRDLNIRLDPRTMLLVTTVASRPGR